MSKQDIKLLKDRDPEQRKIAIKRVAKEVDRNALLQLAKMAGDDPDAEIRELARKAGVYIRIQIGEIEAPAKDKDGKKPDVKQAKIAVSAQDEQTAQRAVEAAMTYNINDDKVKAIKYLKRAMDLNPNLKSDGYFINLAETMTGVEGKKALDALLDEERVSTIAADQQRAIKEKDTAAHEEKISVVGWDGVAFDMVLLFIVMAVGSMLATFVLMQSAEAFVERVEANMDLVLSNATDAEGNPIDPIVIEQSFAEFSDLVNETPFSQVFINGVIVGIGAVLSLLVYCLIIHFAAYYLFKGHGTYPYLAHRWSTLFASRSVIIYFLMYISIAAIFGDAGNFNPLVYILLGAMLLVTLNTFSKGTGIVRQSYNFGFLRAFMTVNIAGLITFGANAVLVLMTGLTLI